MKYLVTMAAVAFLVLPVSTAAAQELDPVVEEIVGLWRLEFTTPDDVDREPLIAVGRIYDELVAYYVGEGALEMFDECFLRQFCRSWVRQSLLIKPQLPDAIKANGIFWAFFWHKH